MKENVFDVLMYLFENYFYEEASMDPDRESLEAELSQAGFGRPEVTKAFDWLDALSDSRHLPSVTAASASRVFTDSECQRLDVECRGFILFLEQAGILSGSSRELVIDRVMALDDEPIDLDALKWVILMVLFSQPDQEEAYVWMESLIFESPAQLLH